MPPIGIIGGSGIYDLPGLRDVRERAVATPFGAPSDRYRLGRLGDAEVVFLARHGRGHRLSPSELNGRANVWGFKKLGCERLISFSAVGSLREELLPGHLVLPDQALDRTVKRAGSFFGEGVVAHVAFAQPTCADLRRHLAAAARSAGAPAVHEGGTMVVMEGPAFSTAAESRLHRSFGGDLIGMTMLPEAKLAREAGLCYATAALVTDFAGWHEGHDAGTVEQGIAVVHANADLARRAAAEAVRALAAAPRACACKDALKNAVMTAPEAIPAAARKRLALLLDPHLPARPKPRAKRPRAAASRARRTR